MALTVTDAERSAAWYSELRGMRLLMSGDEDTVRFRVLVHPESGWVLGVREYTEGSSDRFDELRTGLDHFAFGVPSREALDDWVQVLDAKAVPHAGVADTPVGSVVTFRDPDNIQLELWYSDV
jgi:catechol 2,3-dioxygenase-like lactoylglutathione lyase family enzyme